MTVRMFNIAQDYQDVKTWWLHYEEWSPIPISSLSSRGYIAEKEGIKLAAGWLYMTDSDIFIMEWLIGNPEVAHEERGKALDMVIDRILSEAKEYGARMVHTQSINERLAKRLVAHKFAKAETTVNYFRSLICQQ